MYYFILVIQSKPIPLHNEKNGLQRQHIKHRIKDLNRPKHYTLNN